MLPSYASSVNNKRSLPSSSTNISVFIILEVFSLGSDHRTVFYLFIFVTLAWSKLLKKHTAVHSFLHFVS